MNGKLVAPLAMALAVPVGIVLAGCESGVPLLAALAPLTWATGALVAVLVLRRERGASATPVAIVARVPGRDLSTAA